MSDKRITIDPRTWGPCHYGCHVKILGEWRRVEFDTEAVLDLAIKAFEAQGYEVV